MNNAGQEKTLQEAMDYFEDILENPDRVIKIKPSFEREFLRSIINIPAINYLNKIGR